MLGRLSAISKVILISGISVILVSGVLLYFGLGMVSDQAAQITREKNHHTRIYALSIEEKFKNTIDILEFTARSGIFDKPFDSEIIHELRGIPETSEPEMRMAGQNILRQYGVFDNVGFTLPNGDMYFVEPYALQLELASLNFAFRDWYKGVIKTNSAYLSETFVAESTGDRTVKAAIPVVDDAGNLMGIWGGILNLGFTSLELDRLASDDGKRIILFDHGGNIVTDTHNIGLDVREKETYYKHVSRSLTGQSGSAADSINNKKFLVTYSPVKVGSMFWSILIIEPYDSAFLAVSSNRDQMFLTLGLVVMIITASSVLRVMIIRREVKGATEKQQEIEHLERDLSSLDAKYERLKLSVPKAKGNTPLQVMPKHYLALITIFVALVGMMNVYLLIENQRIEYSIGLLSKPMSTGYVIQNLRGDTMDTWLSWKMLPGSELVVNIKNPDVVTLEQLDAARNAILSTELVAIDDSLLHKGPKGSTSLYYLGWKGALDSVADRQTKLFIPNSIRIVESASGEGDIIIEFTTLRSGDGYMGYTKSIADESQILKSNIVIYNVNDLTAEQMGTIIRHEFGHALGLGHSTAPEDLMAPVIQTDYPYISECVIDAILELYDGGRHNQIVCEK